jgi:hypothetical protein
MSFLIALSDSIICWPPWLFGHEGLDLGAIEKHLACDPKDL